MLFNNSDEGVAVPISAEAWHYFYSGLIKSREQLQILRDNPLSTPQKNVSACVGCPLGKPRLLGPEKTIRNGVPITPFGAEITRKAGNKNITIVLHSTCGDFYRWIPPHEKALEDGLGR